MGPGIAVFVELIAIANKEDGRWLLGATGRGVEGCFGGGRLASFLSCRHDDEDVPDVGCSSRNDQPKKQGFGVWDVSAFDAIVWGRTVIPAALTPCS